MMTLLQHMFSQNNQATPSLELQVKKIQMMHQLQSMGPIASTFEFKIRSSQDLRVSNFLIQSYWWNN